MSNRCKLCLRQFSGACSFLQRTVIGSHSSCSGLVVSADQRIAVSAVPRSIVQKVNCHNSNLLDRNSWTR